MATEGERLEPGESEQDEEEDVYEVERIIDMREEEGEVLYRVRWKNYCSDDDTWEPEAHLEDCREVLLAFKKNIADAKKEAEAKKIVKLPTKSDVFDADSESDSEKDVPAPEPVKKKKKKKKREEDEQELPAKDKKKKKDKRRDRPLPAPETEDEEEEEEEERAQTPSPTLKEKKTELKKRLMDSEDEDEAVPSKKHKKDKGKQVKKDKEKGDEGKKKKVKKEKKMESSEDEATAPMDEDLSDGPSEPQNEDPTLKDTVKFRSDDKSKEKKGKWEVKLQGIKDLIVDKKVKKADSTQKESSIQKLRSLTSKSKEESALHSDSSDSSTLHKKPKSKGKDSLASSSGKGSSSSVSSSSTATLAAGTKSKEEESSKEESVGPKDSTGPTNMFEKFLMNCEAKDRAPRRQPNHPPAAEKSAPKPTKLVGKIDKIPKPTKESPAQKTEPEKTERVKQSDASKPQSHGFSLDSDEREDSRERREKPEEQQKFGWEKRSTTDDKRKKREDSEPRLLMACDDSQETQEPQEAPEKTGTEKPQATLSLGMDLNLDWMTMDDFQKHLNGEDEILSGPPLSPSELRDAVKSGDYMAVKLALNSKEDYNLDQEATTVSSVAVENDSVSQTSDSSVSEELENISQRLTHLETLMKDIDCRLRCLENPHAAPEKGGDSLSAGHYLKMEDTGEDPNLPCPTPETSSAIPDIAIRHLPAYREEEFYKLCIRKGVHRPEIYAARVFMAVTPFEVVRSWHNNVNWSGIGGKKKLPENLKKLIHQMVTHRFPNLTGHEWGKIRSTIHERIRSHRKTDPELLRPGFNR